MYYILKQTLIDLCYLLEIIVIYPMLLYCNYSMALIFLEVKFIVDGNKPMDKASMA